MAWVRYDDTFYGNPKVTAVVAEDPGALALHLLANTWTNGQKTPGFVPVHQPAVLLCDRSLGAKWAEVLVHSGLWHERRSLCDECAEEYAHVPAPAEGFVFHNAKEYRAPARDRTTPGTPADLSEKRRAAGRKGGRASAAKRGHNGQDEQAREANSVSKNGNLLPAGVSPEPVPVPEPTELPTEVLFGAPPAASPPTATKKTRTTSERGTRIPDDFGISKELRDWAAAEIPGFDIDREFPRFRDYWRSQTGQKAVKKEWPAVFRNWMRRAFDDRGPSLPSPASGLPAQQGRQHGYGGGYPDRNGVAMRDVKPALPSEVRKAQGWLALGADSQAEYANGGRP